MLEVICSDRLEALSEALAGRIAGSRTGPLAMFDRAVVVAPNREVATHVELDLARRHGIAANIAFPFLESFFANLVPSHGGIRVLDGAKLHDLIHHVLAQPDHGIEPAARYIAAGADDDARDRRAFQLARKLASLFIDYRLSLPELIAGWKSGPLFQTMDRAESEVWQRALWLKIFGPGGLTDRLADDTGQRWLLLPDAIAAVPIDDLAISPAAIHVIGFSILPPAYIALLERIASRGDIIVYAVSPSAKLWDEVRADDPDASLLARWGAAGRQTFRLLVQAVDGNVGDAFGPGEPRSLLSHVQRAFLDLEDPADVIAGCELDGSLEVLACSSPRRELEVIAREIWQSVNADPTLRFCDIAVLIAGDRADDYLAQVGAVFRDAEDLPHHAAGLPLTAESRLGEAFEHILALPRSRFTRFEVLRAATHPAVLASFSASDPQLFIRLADELGIAHGADESDHEGTYIEEGLFHWDWGIRRLSLGAFMDANPTAEQPPVRIGDDEYLHLALDGDRLAGGLRLARIARTLIADARRLGKRRLRLTEWARVFDRVAADYLAAEDERDQRALDRIRDAAARLGDGDILGDEVGYTTAREHMLAELSGLRERRGQYLADGVFVAPLAARRPLPHRVIFCAGLTEGWFPSQSRPGPLDLRVARPEAGVLSRAAQDRYAFLETLLAARDRLILSYVARNEITGEARNPASVVVEIGDTVAASLGEAAREKLVTHEPPHEPVANITGSENAPAICPLPYAHRRAQARALRESALLAIKDGAFDGESFAQALAEHPQMPDRFGLAPQPLPDAEFDRERLSVSLSALRRFLEDPLQAWGSSVLGLSQDDDEEAEAAAVIDEPFVSERRVSVPLLRRVFAEVMGCDVPGNLEMLLSRYREQAHRLMLAGNMPTGAFADAERAHHERWLASWRDGLLASAPNARARFVRIGQSGVDAVPLSLSVPLGADSSPITVGLTGDVDLVIDGQGPVVLAHKPKDEKSRWRFLLRALWDQLILAAAGILADCQTTALVLYDGALEQMKLSPWSQQEAQAHLAALITELYTQPHTYLMKGDETLKWLRAKKRTKSLTEQLDGKEYSPFGPIQRVTNLAAPEDAEDIARRRLEPLAQRWHGG